MKAIGLCVSLALVVFVSSCVIPTVAAPLPSDDRGPKPKDPGAVIAAWLNARSISLSHHPFTSGEFIMSDPTPVVLVGPTGRKAGWQVVLGPENARLVDFTEVSYTRVIMNRDRVISFTASSFPP